MILSAGIFQFQIFDGFRTIFFVPLIVEEQIHSISSFLR